MGFFMPQGVQCGSMETESQRLRVWPSLIYFWMISASEWVSGSFVAVVHGVVGVIFVSSRPSSRINDSWRYCRDFILVSWVVASNWACVNGAPILARDGLIFVCGYFAYDNESVCAVLAFFELF
jgi:hypothetical protein